MDLDTYVSAIAFNFIWPETSRGNNRRFPIRREGSEPGLLELPGAHVDICNSSLPPQQAELGPPLRRLCDMPRMSTLAFAALINNAVACMPTDHAYVNVGVWAGFSLLAGMLENPEKRCIGIDNFSQWSGARDGLLRRFEAMKGPAHDFYEGDYRDYLAIHRGPIGVYLYDGDHAYDHQRLGLQLAEPFFGDACVVVVDDTNWRAPREATIDFVADSAHEYEIVLDMATSGHCHPTFWNGIMVLRRTGRKRAKSADRVRSEFEDREYGPTRPPGGDEEEDHRPAKSDAQAVSIVLVHDHDSEQTLRPAIEASLGQTWPDVELVVLDRSEADAAEMIARDYPGVGHVAVPENAGDSRVTFAHAISRTTGDLVAFADTIAPLRNTAVEIAMTLPGGVPFFRHFGEGRYAEWERKLGSG
jgi:Methyltransferase domain/Glycosyl transferase family 2